MIDLQMQYSKQGLSLTEKYEGCKLVAYRDSFGILTIGYGHTRGVFEGMICSQEQAVLWLHEDVKVAEIEVNHCVHTILTQGEFDALVDFAFNLGGLRLEHSTLLAYVNARNFSLAAAEFTKWDHAGGKVLAGLFSRRLAETAEFKS